MVVTMRPVAVAIFPFNSSYVIKGDLKENAEYDAAKVTITNLNTKKQLTYQIVSEKEADLKLNKISITSPIGKGLMGKVIGDVAEVQAPAGVMKFKVENISA